MSRGESTSLGWCASETKGAIFGHRWRCLPCCQDSDEYEETSASRRAVEYRSIRGPRPSIRNSHPESRSMPSIHENLETGSSSSSTLAPHPNAVGLNRASSRETASTSPSKRASEGTMTTSPECDGTKESFMLSAHGDQEEDSNLVARMLFRKGFIMERIEEIDSGVGQEAGESTLTSLTSHRSIASLAVGSSEYGSREYGSKEYGSKEYGSSEDSEISITSFGRDTVPSTLPSGFSDSSPLNSQKRKVGSRSTLHTLSIPNRETTGSPVQSSHGDPRLSVEVAPTEAPTLSIVLTSPEGGDTFDLVKIFGRLSSLARRPPPPESRISWEPEQYM